MRWASGAEALDYRRELDVARALVPDGLRVYCPPFARESVVMAGVAGLGLVRWIIPHRCAFRILLLYQPPFITRILAHLGAPYHRVGACGGCVHARKDMAIFRRFRPEYSTLDSMVSSNTLHVIPPLFAMPTLSVRSRSSLLRPSSSPILRVCKCTRHSYSLTRYALLYELSSALASDPLLLHCPNLQSRTLHHSLHP
ncbi:hypothetical protein EXIGLDRAFT_30308 [Exidia glandulosa HHB12029]|uniref:Uncharacterized protein n=1 Tax=Exidia glandulosa HHB12029 TaxID=1314781 RepID=A0A165PB64_EXIGL|nr:hypothetical protein EXIGLDRAFT_30308 [Exidia glandulosa HHB12029]